MCDSAVNSSKRLRRKNWKKEKTITVKCSCDGANRRGSGVLVESLRGI